VKPTGKKGSGKPLALYWYDEGANFGDALNPLLVRHVLGVPVAHARSGNCAMCAVGSILEHFFADRLSLRQRVNRWARGTVVVWGGGFIQPEGPGKYRAIRKLDVRAVRGRLSLKRVRRYLHLENEIAVGDPGLLCSRLVDCRGIQKRYELGIIPHYVDRDNPLLGNIRVGNSVVIDVRAPVLDVLRQIASCKAVISSAMHGLIASDSLGVPNIRMVLGGKIVGGDYKFDDYYSAFGIRNHPRIVLDESTIIEDAGFISEGYGITRQMAGELADNLLSALLPEAGIGERQKAGKAI
jgi:hypothetical protein